jgi:hypothetical protein
LDDETYLQMEEMYNSQVLWIVHHKKRSLETPCVMLKTLCVAW